MVTIQSVNFYRTFHLHEYDHDNENQILNRVLYFQPDLLMDNLQEYEELNESEHHDKDHR
jgi:hypothetical protein